MSCCSSFVDCVPVLAVLFLMAWSYYAYVVTLCIDLIIRMENTVKGTIYLTIYHYLLVMILWTYFKVICSDIAVVPKIYKIPRNIYEEIIGTDDQNEKNDLLLIYCDRQNLVLYTRTEHDYIRFCNKCKQVKPDRAHHCSKCKTCVLKMDHHCPWVNNCIGFSNYKYFVLLLLYAALYCIFYTGTTMEYFIVFWQASVTSYDMIHAIVGCFVASGFATILLSFYGYHVSLISKNETTLEALKKPYFFHNNTSLTFNIGTRNNLEEVFGNNCCLWFIPVESSFGDGLYFPVRLMV